MQSGGELAPLTLAAQLQRIFGKENGFVRLVS